MVKRATSLFNSFCSNVAKQVARFCCPFYHTLRNDDDDGDGNENVKKADGSLKGVFPGLYDYAFRFRIRRNKPGNQRDWVLTENLHAITNYNRLEWK